MRAGRGAAAGSAAAANAPLPPSRPPGDRLLVSCSNHTHYLYATSALDAPPAALLSGHRSSSYYLDACFSPDGSLVASGSADGGVYVWSVSARASPSAMPARPNARLPAF